jgi:RNA polymerase sigma-70 factor (ECF subfamily)
MIAGNRHEAEEVMQDAFLSLFERWDRVRAMEDSTGYLYRTAINAFRRRSRRAALALRRTFVAAQAVDEFQAADDRQVVSQVLAKLSRKQRAALVLTELLGYGSEDAGKMMGVRAVTVRALASQGRAASLVNCGAQAFFPSRCSSCAPAPRSRHRVSQTPIRSREESYERH